MTTDTEITDTTGTESGATEDRDSAAGWFVRARVDQLLDNPADARGGDRDQAALVELAASIRSVGLLQALTVVPDPADRERFVIYAGHRRRDAARLAAAQLVADALGHDISADPALLALEVDPDSDEAHHEAGTDVVAAAERLRWLPCLVRPDLAAEVGMEIAAGLIENGVRDGLTTGQRARAAEQLSLADGWTITRIATATGLSRTQARAAASLPRLGETARQATYRGELSLEHAAVLDELAADGATDDELGLLARSGSMFDHHVAELRKTLRRRSAAAALRDEADLRGWALYDEPDGYPLDSPLAPLWSLSRGDDPAAAPLLPRHGEDADPTCSRVASPYALLPDHGVLLHNDPWEDPHLEVVCADPDAHGYRRDPRSMLYVEPDVEPDAEVTPDHAETATEPPPALDEPDPTGEQDSGDTPADRDVELPASGHTPPRPTGGAPGVDHHADQDRHGQDTGNQDQSDPEWEAETRRRRAEAEAREEQRRAEAAEAAEQAARQAAERAAENERIEAERAARQARHDALETAAETRWRHTAGLLRTQKGATGHGELPAVVLARFPWLLSEADDLAGAQEVTALCAEPDRDPATGTQRWSAGRVTHRAVVMTAWLLHQNLTATSLVEAPTVEAIEAEPAAWWLDYLTARGYQPAEVETELRAALDEIITGSLAAEHGDPTGEGDSQRHPGSGSDPQ